MTLRELLSELPMGLGYLLPTLMEKSLPELAARLDTTVRRLGIEFEGQEPMFLCLDEILGGEKNAGGENGSGLEGDGGAAAGTPSLAG